MADPFVGEIRLFAFKRVPSGWFACEGQHLPIAEYQVLFSLIGTTFGGDGSTTFFLPDLRGRVPVGHGPMSGGRTYPIGEKGGSETVTLTEAQLPKHGHALRASYEVAKAATPGTTVHTATDSPDGVNPGGNLYAPAQNATSNAVLATSVSMEGGGQPHPNVMPTLVGNYCICFEGVYPPPP